MKSASPLTPCSSFQGQGTSEVPFCAPQGLQGPGMGGFLSSFLRHILTSEISRGEASASTPLSKRTPIFQQTHSTVSQECPHNAPLQ